MDAQDRDRRPEDHPDPQDGRARPPAQGDTEQPAPGPHADPALTDHEKTPGSGALPEPGDASGQKEADPGAG